MLGVCVMARSLTQSR